MYTYTYVNLIGLKCLPLFSPPAMPQAITGHRLSTGTLDPFPPDHLPASLSPNPSPFPQPGPPAGEPPSKGFPAPPPRFSAAVWASSMPFPTWSVLSFEPGEQNGTGKQTALPGKVA